MKTLDTAMVVQMQMVLERLKTEIVWADEHHSDFLKQFQEMTEDWHSGDLKEAKEELDNLGDCIQKLMKILNEDLIFFIKVFDEE